METSQRRTNKYVRSDSTISEDGSKSIKTYTQDGRQISFDEGILSSQGDAVMNAICEEKLKGDSLHVDISPQSSSFNQSTSRVTPNTRVFEDLSRTFENEIGSNSLNQSSNPAIPVQCLQIKPDDGQVSNNSTVQYSTMAFNTDINDNKTEDSDSASNIPSATNNSSQSKGSSPSASDSVQYSAIAFPTSTLSHNSNSSTSSTCTSDASKADSTITTDSASDSVQYSTMAFPGSALTQPTASTGQPVTSTTPPTSSSDSVQYSTMAFNSPSSIESHSKDSYIPVEDNSNSIQYTTIVSNDSQDSDDDEAPPIEHPKANRKQNVEDTTPVIQSTLFGAKVNYDAEQFRFRHSPISRRKRPTHPNIIGIAAVDRYAKTL